MLEPHDLDIDFGHVQFRGPISMSDVGAETSTLPPIGRHG
jgi:hypothetical protein